MAGFGVLHATQLIGHAARLLYSYHYYVVDTIQLQDQGKASVIFAPI